MPRDHLPLKAVAALRRSAGLATCQRPQPTGLVTCLCLRPELHPGFLTCLRPEPHPGWSPAYGPKYTRVSSLAYGLNPTRVGHLPTARTTARDHQWPPPTTAAHHVTARPTINPHLITASTTAGVTATSVAFRPKGGRRAKRRPASTAAACNQRAHPGVCRRHPAARPAVCRVHQPPGGAVCHRRGVPYPPIRPPGCAVCNRRAHRRSAPCAPSRPGWAVCNRRIHRRVCLSSPPAPGCAASTLPSPGECRMHSALHPRALSSSVPVCPNPGPACAFSPARTQARRGHPARRARPPRRPPGPASTPAPPSRPRHLSRS
jgi:hypothetical protein